MTSFLRQASVGFKKIVPSVVFLTLLSMFALPLSQSHATSFTNGLVGHWKLDETSGTTAVDSSGSGNNGTLTNGPTISTDHATTIFSNARALSFDGSNDKVLYGNVLGSVFQGDYTVSLWVKSETTSFGRLIGKADYVNGDSPFSVLFNYPSTGKINLYVGTNADVNALASVSADLNNGHWRHLTFQRIGTVQNIFVDGVLDATVTRSTSPGTNSSQLTIGHDGSGDGLETQQFGGNIDDVRVYNRALSPEEISVLAAEKSLVGYWKFDETNGTSVADSSGMGNTGTHTNSPTISTDVPDDINFTDGRSLSFDGTDTYVDLGNNPSLNLSGGEATFTFWIKPTALSSYYQSIIEKRDAGLSGQEYEVFFDTNGKLGFYNGTVFTSTYTLNTNIWTHVAVSVSDSDTCTFYANGVSVYSIGSCFIGPTSSANAIIGYFNGGALDLQPFNGLLDDIRIYNRALSSTEITALAAGNHPPATWTGEHSTYYEDPNNWNTGVVPDPYSNVTIANAGARPVLTDAVSLSDLTINSSASLDLKDKNLTQLDGGTFSNNGTLVLDGSQTLTNFTNDTNSGQEIIRSSSNLTSFAPGDSYYNLRIEDPTENGLVGYWKLDEGSGSLTTDLSGNGNNGTLVNGAAFSTSTGSTNFYNPGSLSFDGANDYVSIANDGSFEFNSHDFSFSSWVRFNTLGFAIATINGSGYSGWEVARYGNVLSFFNGGTWAYSTQDFTQGQWAHIAVINNGTNTSFFFNGEAVGVVAQGRPNNSGNAPLRLASRSDANYSNVILDDVRIYNRALSAKEVANLAKGRYAAGASSTATHTPDAPLVVNGTLSLDSGSLESENGLSVGGQLSLLRGGGNLTLVSTATTTLNGGLTVSGATLTGGDGTVDVNGDVLILTGSLLSTTGVMSITGDFTKSGGTFNHNDGRITFDGSAGQLITPSDATFNGIIIYKDAGTVSLAGPLICTSLNVASGTLSPGSYPVTTNQMYVSGGTFTGASGRLDINKSLAISDGTLTAPSGVMTLSGSLTESIDGIFNHNNGRVILDSASPANLAVAEPFNDLTVNDGLAAYWKFDETSGGTAPDVSGNGYNLGIGGAPVISTDVADTNFPNARSWGFGSNYSYANGVTGIADTFTVSGFFRADATGGGTLINYRTPSTNNGWMITTSGFGTTGGRLVFNYGGVGTYEIDPLTHPMSQGVYNYFAMTVANGTATAYWTTTSGGAVYSNSVAIGSPSGSLSELIVGAGFGGNFTGLLDDLRVYNRVLSLPEITLLSQGNLRASDNAVTLGSALDVNGDLTLMTGGLDASVSDFDINVAGDWNNSGIFSAQQCTVTLDGTNQSIVGDTTFYNLTKSVTAADTLTFGSGSYTTIANTVTFNGAADNLLSLRSSVDGNQWYFDPQGTRALAYLDVKDSNNFGTTPIMAAGLNITDSGNLTNWIFDETPPGIASISPVNGSSNVSLTPTLVLTLNEESDSVADKHITIKKASDHSTVETISVTSGLVTVSGAVVTIRPSVALSANTTYYVLVDSGAFTDSADNEFAGIAATSAWSFTTVASEEEEELPASGADSAGGGAYRGVAGAGGRSDKAQVVRETFLRRFERQVASDETTIPPISGSGSSSRSSRPAFVKAPATSTGVVVAEKRGHLEVTRQNVAVVYKDVPVDAWFAPYVSFLIEEDIAQGYKDDAGKAKGEFGVENAVTYAELAKMVLQASHKDLKTAAAPRNATARGTWASPFIALSEDLHFSVYVPTLDIMKPATRGEVIQTILEAFDIPVSAKNFATFSDLPATHPYGPAIGVAYLYGLIDGDTNPDGTQKGTVRPDDEVNRAEVAKIIALALKLLK